MGNAPQEKRRVFSKGVKRGLVSGKKKGVVYLKDMTREGKNAG